MREAKESRGIGDVYKGEGVVVVVVVVVVVAVVVVVVGVGVVNPCPYQDPNPNQALRDERKASGKTQVRMHVVAEVG